MGDKYYAYEKFGSAVRHLATTSGDIRERLREARAKFSPITEGDLPTTEAREALRAINARLNWAESTGQGTLPATLALITEQEGCAIAGLISDVEGMLAFAIIEAQKNGEPWGKHHDDDNPEGE